MSFIRENSWAIDHYINLDVIPEGETSYRNYKFMKENGLNPIPVYHTSSPIKYSDYYKNDSNYISLSETRENSVKAKIRVLNYLWSKYLTDSEGFPSKTYLGSVIYFFFIQSA